MATTHKDRENIILVLQGGGALGAYQAGVFEALSENGFSPQWIAGISIGAINGALIAGNRPENRVARLRSFWERVSSGATGIPLVGDGHHRTLFNEASGLMSLAFGVKGFFTPRFPPPVFMAADGPESVSYYSTEPLAESLAEFVDFDYLNREGPRLSVGAVNIATGNLAFFDREKEPLRPEHVLASGALPPGLPPVRIGRDYYWDGGLVSNTPLQYVLDESSEPQKFIFQVDLFSARGGVPRNLLEAAEREKEIRYSGRTRFNTDMAAKRIEYRAALARLLRKLPPELRGDVDAKLLAEIGEEPAVTIVHL
ncbi:MAG TPA: patatin-like phospholipase family protein, partial [Nordella sp.]|nr:patatin-like phospholipase family protein [Nordella sp.]